jgi:hypothetical protein
MTPNRLNLLLAASGLCTALLAACGGGGSDGSTSTPASPTTPTTPTSSALSISGTAATGAAIASGTVSVKCAAGTATSATTAADGSYSVSVTSGALPCVLQVTSSDSATTLYSVAAGSGNNATANITPLTQLVVASLAGAEPAAYFTSFDSGAASGVTSAAVSSAQSAVVTTLAAAGIDVSASAVGDLLTGTLTAKSSTTTAGNAYDVALDTLAATLASTGTTLATLTTTVAVTSPVAPDPTPTTSNINASLPADLLLKTAASNCSALRSGSYRVILPRAGAALADQYGTITIDAGTLGITFTDGSTGTWAANGTCRYLDDNGKTDIVVSQAGVLVARSYDSDTATYRPVIGIPLQSHTLAQLEGTWNMLGMQYDSASAAYVGATASATFSATGTLSAVSACSNTSTWSVASCTDQTDLPSFQANADGGFDVIEAGGTTAGGRTFAYRAGNGDLMMVHVDGDGSFEVRTKQRTNALPEKDRVFTGWDFRFTNHWLATPLVTESTNTVTDVAASSFTRLAKTVGGTDEHLETVLVNSPRTGYNFRAAATVTGTDGTTVVNVAEWTNLALRGMGLNALLRPAQKQFMFSVQQP